MNFFEAAQKSEQLKEQSKTQAIVENKQNIQCYFPEVYALLTKKYESKKIEFTGSQVYITQHHPTPEGSMVSQKPSLFTIEVWKDEVYDEWLIEFTTTATDRHASFTYTRDSVKFGYNKIITIFKE